MKEQFTYRDCYINFASHLLNRFNPNMLYPKLSYRWSKREWLNFIDMIKGFGFNIFEFWLVPDLFCREAINSPVGIEFSKQINTVSAYAASKGIRTKMACALATVGPKWHTYCPNIKEEWKECLYLWCEWTKRLDGLNIVNIGPGDPGACNRNGCTAETFIDKTLEVTSIIKKNLPNADVEIGTWGNPFFGWGCIQGPHGWSGEFVQSYQHTAWAFSKQRSDNAMKHLLRRLPDFPENMTVAINLAFNPDGDPKANSGIADARMWANEIAKTNPIITWDFSLTEGENAIIPHYRFERLFSQRKLEREAAPYRGGICFTMSPLLNQLSLYMSAQSFINPDEDPTKLVDNFCCKLFGPSGSEIAKLLPLFEIIPDWGNYTKIDISHECYNKAMKNGVELMQEAKSSINNNIPFAPSTEEYRRTLLWYFRLFKKLSGTDPDFGSLRKEYWNKVYAIYNCLPAHVDPRPIEATDRLINYFNPNSNTSGPIAGKWTD